MTTLGAFLERLARIHVPAGSPRVCTTVAEEIRARFAPHALGGRPRKGPGASLVVRVCSDGARKPWVRFHADASDGATLEASHAHHLFAFWAWLADVKPHESIARFRRGTKQRPAFAWERPVYDLYFAQSARSVRNMDREAYVRAMACGGFTHLEVNALAFPEAIEDGPPGEVYPRFYTYCPALDQFVDSFLNRGTYPRSYLRANLKHLKANADLAGRYGLVPTLTCFEPRSVPESLLAKWPELRGCRVDHPFRSFKPRFNLAVSHPVVKRHYRELMQNLVKAVPSLGCLSLWTNDSGAGFEFTRTLYVGPNGSAYLVREWSEEDVFTKAAADNVVGFLRLLQESAAEIQPDFRVTTRLEPFTVERDAVMKGLGKGLDVEVPSLLTTGWDVPYGHPTYEDSQIGPFTIYNNAFHAEESPHIKRLARRDCLTHVMHANGPVNNFEPLLHVPAPRLTYEKLRALHEVGATHLTQIGGMAPPDSVPWDVNREVFRRFQHEPRLDLEAALLDVARSWVGAEHAPDLVEIWRQVEEAVRGFMPNPLYFLWGVWYRLDIRPLVPDIDAVPERARAYYERHLLTTHHNPTRVDLSRDVLFHLMSPKQASQAVSRIRRYALPPLREACARAERLAGTAQASVRAVFVDLRDRLRALTCSMVTRKGVATWIADVHGYLRARSDKTRAACRKRLAAMVSEEIENAKSLRRLWKTSEVEFMAVSEGAETTFIYDANFGRHLGAKIRLMERYGDLEPRIDPSFLWQTLRTPYAQGRSPRTSRPKLPHSQQGPRT